LASLPFFWLAVQARAEDNSPSATERASGIMPITAPSDPDTKVPGFRLAPQSCDTHTHIFGPASRYPYASKRPYTPPLGFSNSTAKVKPREAVCLSPPTIVDEHDPQARRRGFARGSPGYAATGMMPVAASVAASTTKAAPDTRVAIRNINRSDPSRLEAVKWPGSGVSSGTPESGRVCQRAKPRRRRNRRKEQPSRSGGSYANH
jgi:hypothetical protein